MVREFSFSCGKLTCKLILIGQGVDNSLIVVDLESIHAKSDIVYPNLAFYIAEGFRGNVDIFFLDLCPKKMKHSLGQSLILHLDK